MKKKLLISVLAAVATCSAVTLSACAPEAEPKHEHDLQPHAGQAATCTEDGWEDYYTCSGCDYTTYQVIPAAHDYHDYICATCNTLDPDAPDTDGLTFTLRPDGQSYSVRKGTATIGKLLKIPSTYESLPVTHITYNAFSNCTELEYLYIPDSIISIDGNPFMGCASLSYIEIDEENTAYHSENNCIINKWKELIVGCKNSVIPSDGSVTSIKQEAFSGCSSLQSINIPESVNSIGSYAFRYCTSLTSAIIDTRDKYYGWVLTSQDPSRTLTNEALANPADAANYLTIEFCGWTWTRDN